MSIVANNQSQGARGIIKSSYIYCDKQVMAEYLVAVDEQKWINVKTHTSTFEETFEIEVVIRINKCKQYDETKDRVVFQISGDLSADSFGKISCKFVKFEIISK